MLQQSEFAVNDLSILKDLVRRHSWCTLVTAHPSRGPIVSHLPVVLDEEAPGMAVFGHLARADAAEHELGAHNIVVVVHGPQGYLSPSWYQKGPHVPTWDFVVLHVFGRPSVLSPEATFSVLEKTVDHLERELPSPWRLAEVDGYARRIAPGAAGFRLDATRFVGKAKLHQDGPACEALRLADFLEAAGPAVTPGRELAQAIRAATSS